MLLQYLESKTKIIYRQIKISIFRNEIDIYTFLHSQQILFLKQKLFKHKKNVIIIIILMAHYSIVDTMILTFQTRLN